MRCCNSVHVGCKTNVSGKNSACNTMRGSSGLCFPHLSGAVFCAVNCLQLHHFRPFLICTNHSSECNQEGWWYLVTKQMSVGEYQDFDFLRFWIHFQIKQMHFWKSFIFCKTWCLCLSSLCASEVITSQHDGRYLRLKLAGMIFLVFMWSLSTF